MSKSNRDDHSTPTPSSGNNPPKGSIVYAFCVNAANERSVPSLLNNCNINCIADLREKRTENTSSIAKELEKLTDGRQIFYHSFYDEMIRYNPLHHTKRGVWKYELALADKVVSDGLTRLLRGCELGYSIAIIDEEPDLHKAMRQKLAGRFFHENGVQVIYVDETKPSITHAQFEQMINAQKTKRMKAQSLGKTGEDLAAQYLTEHGFTIVDRNWNLHRGCEIDIVARKGEAFHCVEVKTRRSDELASPVSAINHNKMRNMCKAASAYRARNGFFGCEFVIDSIGIVLRSDDDYDLNMYENIATIGK